jgi:hypothetical protein
VPLPASFSTRRLLLGGLLVLTAMLAVLSFLTAWEPTSPERRTFDLIQLGMDERQVYAIAHDWHLLGSGHTLIFVKAGSRPGSWSIVTVDLDDERRVMDKGFEQGGKSSFREWADRFLREPALGPACL